MIVLIGLNFWVSLRGGITPDEQVYMEMTKEISLGHPVYQTYVDHQPPGIAIANVPFVWIFGYTALAAKAGNIFYHLLLIWAVVMIVGKLGQSTWTTRGAGILTAIYAMAFRGADVSSYAAIFTAVALAAALIYLNVKNWRMTAGVFVSGLLFGFAIWTKPSVPLELPALFLIIYVCLAKDQRSLKKLLSIGGKFIAGIVAMSGLILVYFAATGDLYEMLYTTVGMNFNFIGLNPFNIEIIPPEVTLQTRAESFGMVFLPNTLPFYALLIMLASAAIYWNLRFRRNAIFWALLFWALVATIHALLTTGLGIRYFSHIIAPFVVLVAYSFHDSSRSYVMRTVLIIAVPLLFFRAVFSPIEPMDAESHGMYASQIAGIQNVLDQNLAKGECVLMWGWISGINYYTDHPPCNRVALEASLFRQETFDTRLMRSWYLQDIFEKRPKMLAREHTWEFYKPLDQLMAYRVGPKVYYDEHFKIEVYKLDWSTFHEGAGTINNEIALVGYDLKAATSLKPGQPLSITMYWKVLKQPTHEYQGFVQIVTGDFSAKVVGVDLPPTEPLRSTNTWKHSGDYVIGRTYELTLPADMKAGDYKLVTGMYGLNDSQTISVDHTDAAGNLLPFIVLQPLTIN
jgi:hypothetical protein